MRGVRIEINICWIPTIAMYTTSIVPFSPQKIHLFNKWLLGASFVSGIVGVDGIESIKTHITHDFEN